MYYIKIVGQNIEIKHFLWYMDTVDNLKKVKCSMNHVFE